MKLGLALLLVVAVGSSADAGIFSKKSNIPKPIDFPVVRPKLREHHKAGVRVKHLSLGADAAVVSTVERA